MSRPLATVQRITALDAIEGADNILRASVLGWYVVVNKRDEFEVGDLAVYMEIDSVPPDEPHYRFLWRGATDRPNNFRIKTIRLRGQISQGILFKQQNVGVRSHIEGHDVTAVLGVTKYETSLPRGSADIEGQFFDGVPKTDEERVQSATGTKRLGQLRGLPYYITVKCDGASMTIAHHDGKVKVASRNFRLEEKPDSAYWNAAKFRVPFGSSLIEFSKDKPWLAIQGELVGPGIQGNRLSLKEHRCLVFDIYNRHEGRYLSYAEMLDHSRVWKFDLVTPVEVGHLFNYTQEQLLTMAEGKYEGTTNEREGIVIRQNSMERLSIKVISNRYLLGGGA